MGRPGAVYPEVLAVERDCLNCDEPFTPAREGWQALYCSPACWRANNGGPGRWRPAAAAASPVPDRLPPKVADAVVAFQETPTHVAEAFAGIRRPARRLVVIGVEHCQRCGVDHQVYGYQQQASYALIGQDGAP